MSNASRHLHIAEILLPMTGEPPRTKAGIVVDESGMIVDIGEAHDLVSKPSDSVTRHAVLMPAFINCHTHLSDAHMTEMIPGGTGLSDWILDLQAKRKSLRDTNPDSAHASVVNELESMRDAGTIAVGEVSNDFRTYGPIVDSQLRARFMFEQIGFMQSFAAAKMDGSVRSMRQMDGSELVDIVLAAHAPYSVSPALIELIVAHNRAQSLFTYIHLAEDPDERELYMSGGGRCRDVLEYFNAWDPSWPVPMQSPIELFEQMGVLDNSFVGVHLTDATQDELKMLASHGCKAILCPRANLHITGRLPDFESIIKNDIQFGLGTDGRGCVATSNVVDDAMVLFERYYDLRPGAILHALCSGGAEILQMQDIGSLTLGKRPGLISVDIENVTEDIRKLEEQILTSTLRQLVATP